MKKIFFFFCLFSNVFLWSKQVDCNVSSHVHHEVQALVANISKEKRVALIESVKKLSQDFAYETEALQDDPTWKYIVLGVGVPVLYCCTVPVVLGCVFLKYYRRWQARRTSNQGENVGA